MTGPRLTDCVLVYLLVALDKILPTRHPSECAPHSRSIRPSFRLFLMHLVHLLL